MVYDAPHGQRLTHRHHRHSLLVSQGADNGAKDHGAPETGDEESPDVLDAVAIVLIQGIHIGASRQLPAQEQRGRVRSALSERLV